MKFIHMADMHLGAMPDAGSAWSDVRAKELWDTFSAICEACNRERADLLLIAGDLFDRQPLKKELGEVAYRLGTLTRTQVVWMAGDADYLREKDLYRTYPWPEHVHFLTGEKLEQVYLPFLDTKVWGMSYTHATNTAPIYDELSPEMNETYHILLGHGGDDEHIPIRIGALATAGFDYVALGHLHTPKIMEREKIAYAGSPEPLQPEETGAHGYILGEITAQGTRLRLVPIAKRAYKRLELPVHTGATTESLLEALRERVANEGTANLYTVVLTGDAGAAEELCPEELCAAGNILEVLDETRTVYDLSQLAGEHENDLIGKYIETMKTFPQEDQTARLALDYGVTALLGGLK
jgi:DNA repair exonuclease SbcCD nuclease subunit